MNLIMTAIVDGSATTMAMAPKIASSEIDISESTGESHFEFILQISELTANRMHKYFTFQL